MNLSKHGFHVLRFDYFGTGDSRGDYEDALPDDWLADIQTAVEELEAISGVRTIRLLGVRLGATLAAIVTPHLPAVDQLVMWDPIVDGQEYLAELRATHDEMTRSSEPPSPAECSPMVEELAGFRTSSKFRERLREIALPSWVELTEAQTLKVKILAWKPGPGLSDFVEAANQQRIEFVSLDFNSDWMNHSDVVLHPHEILNKLSAEE